AATAVVTIGGGAAFVFFMLLVGRPLLEPLGRHVEHDGTVTPAVMVTALTVLMICAWTTDAIGIYAVFGAFVAGVAMPRGRLVEAVTANLDMLTTTFFVPVFFVYSGLNTRLGLLAASNLWAIAAVVLVIAIAGKGLACFAAARLAGEEWRDAVTVGVL